MKFLLLFGFAGLLLGAGNVAAQTADTVRIGPGQLQRLKPGRMTYLVYNRKTLDGPAERLMLVNITVEAQRYENQPAFAIRQRWDLNGVTVHTANTVCAARDFATLRHDTYWQRIGYATTFDFGARKISYQSGVPDSVQRVYQRDFDQSFNQYNLNWHSDLIIFSLLPYKDKRTFKINFYDPGFGPSQETLYTVVGTEALTGAGGVPVPCWILEHKSVQPGTGGTNTQRFWVAKKTREVLREEDAFLSGHRYKLKTEASQSGS